MASVQNQCEDAFVTAIQALSVTGVTSSEIVARRWPWAETTNGKSGIIHRGITVHPRGWQKAKGTNVREDVGYGVGMTLCLPGDLAGTSNRDVAPAILDAIHDKLVEDRISITLTGGNFLTVTWDFEQLQVPKEFFNWEVSTMTAWCWVRRSRT